MSVRLLMILVIYTYGSRYQKMLRHRTMSLSFLKLNECDKERQLPVNSENLTNYPH